MIGVLSLQGDFAAHGAMLARLGLPWREVRRVSELLETDGLVMPGGESSTMLKILKEEGLFDALQGYIAAGKPVFGTCAGAILLAKDVSRPEQDSLGALDIAVVRNGYGRQLDSFTTTVTPPPALGNETPLELVFIRAPLITRVGDGVEVLIEHQGHPVLVRKGTVLAATFHPEMTDDTRIHALFANSIKN